MTKTPVFTAQVTDGEAMPTHGPMQDYDPYDFRRPRKARISTITGRPTKLTEETELQIQCVTLYRKRCKADRALKENTRLYAVSPNDGKIPAHQRQLAQRMGKASGIYDLHLLIKKYPTISNAYGTFKTPLLEIHWIECKATGGSLSDEQDKWWTWLSRTHVKTHVVKSVGEFVKILEGGK